jgi:hypothetical protein
MLQYTFRQPATAILYETDSNCVADAAKVAYSIILLETLLHYRISECVGAALRGICPAWHVP